MNPGQLPHVWYLAHPVSPDSHFTTQENADHAVHMMRLLFNQGFRTVAPWHTCIQALDDTNPDHRAIGLEIDLEILRRLGRIILTGHKISWGMQVELRFVQSLCDRSERERKIIDLTGLSDSQAVEQLNIWINTHYGIL